MVDDKLEGISILNVSYQMNLYLNVNEEPQAALHRYYFIGVSHLQLFLYINGQ